MASERVKQLAEAYRRWEETKGGSVEDWVALFADEVDCRSFADDLDEVPCAQPSRTREEMRRYLTDVVTEWEMIHFRVDRFIEQNDDVVMIGSTAWRNRVTGKEAACTKVDLWRFAGDKVVSLTELVDTAKVAAACRPD